MKVWCVQTGYRMDYQILAVCGTPEIAEKRRKEYMEGLTESARLNPSWEAFVTEHDVQLGDEQ